jgi:hypothetical protein
MNPTKTANERFSSVLCIKMWLISCCRFPAEGGTQGKVTCFLMTCTQTENKPRAVQFIRYSYNSGWKISRHALRYSACKSVPNCRLTAKENCMEAKREPDITNEIETWRREYLFMQTCRPTTNKSCSSKTGLF